MRFRLTLTTLVCATGMLAGTVGCTGKVEPAPATAAPPGTSSPPIVTPPQRPQPPADAGTSPGVDGGATPDAGVTPTDPPADPVDPPPTEPQEPEPPPPAESQYTRVLWVSPSGNDSAAGTQALPLRTVARALSLVKPGEAVFLLSGTWREPVQLTERGGTASKPLTLRAAPGATATLKGGSIGRTALVDVSGAYWNLQGLTVDVGGERTFAVMWRGAGAHHGVLKDSVLKNGTEGSGVYVTDKAHDVLIENNDISHFDQGEVDSHGVTVQTSASNVVVRGNDIHHNSGDGVQCLGPEGGATNPGTPFDNLLVEDNRLHDNRENGADIKTCTRVTLRGNTVYNHRAVSTAAGEGIIVHMSPSDVTLEDNVFYANARAIQIGGNREGAPPTRVILRRNVIHDGLGEAEGEEGTGIRVDASVDVKVQHNTVWNLSGACLIFGAGSNGSSQGLDVRNNIFAGCGTAARAGSGRSGAVVDGNLYFRSGGAVSFHLDGATVSLADWRSKAGLDKRSQERAPGFVDTGADDYQLAAQSPAREAGLSLGLPFCGAAPDQGAFESGCP
ncbi:right-handed parallel beta-helix repeat-containing protein [Corallococcus macrosporus]|uniref:Right-handed parallel beta-helix repeat-containing protein n=1 Tax=Corallococcus macrosporus TaxID=35 RepID=A0ABS3DHH5_9BACT|nr:right-handed parallel beta-helix repeat-containing protein [Corallococcus macrosporus]MBN8230778.1 right-handed parallel beta-helix repeat-containing protein [Corallococcus macrosporus]